jgi:hypothetical protein
VTPNNPWSDPKGPPPDLNLPVGMGPMTLPQMSQAKSKRRWAWLLLWTVLVFVGGVAAGPVLTDQAFGLVDRVAPMLGVRPPRLAENRRPAAPSGMSLPSEGSAAVPEPAPAPAPEPVVGEPKRHAGEAQGELPALVAKPTAADKEADSERPTAVAPSRAPSAARPVVAALPAHAESAVVEPPATRSHHGKGAAKANSSASTKKASAGADSFSSTTGSASEPKVAAPSSKSKPASRESAAAEKRAPEPKPAAARSNDSLDSLMADGGSDSKGKKRESKDLDALLKDVQKSKPAPPPKHEDPPPASPLSPGDISRVMAGVKTRGNACAQRLGQKGNAELKITVGKSGAVTDVQVGGKVANTALAECIDKAIRAAKFPASSGLKFDYRIDVR